MYWLVVASRFKWILNHTTFGLQWLFDPFLGLLPGEESTTVDYQAMEDTSTSTFSVLRETMEVKIDARLTLRCPSPEGDLLVPVTWFNGSRVIGWDWDPMTAFVCISNPHLCDNIKKIWNSKNDVSSYYCYTLSGIHHIIVKNITINNKKVFYAQSQSITFRICFALPTENSITNLHLLPSHPRPRYKLF